MSPTGTGETQRTGFGRKPERGSHERHELDAVLDAGIVGHIAVVDDGQPYAMPVAYARDGDVVLIHGSTGSRLFRLLANGAPACFTVTLVDGLVLARSAFASSMNYRSAMVLGTLYRLEGDAEREALTRLTAHLLPGRESEARAASKREQAATLTLALPLTEFSVKLRDGGPIDEQVDLDDPQTRAVWAGHVPIRATFDEPVPSPTNVPGTATPDYVLAWLAD